MAVSAQTQLADSLTELAVRHFCQRAQVLQSYQFTRLPMSPGIKHEIRLTPIELTQSLHSVLHFPPEATASPADCANPIAIDCAAAKSSAASRLTTVCRARAAMFADPELEARTIVGESVSGPERRRGAASKLARGRRTVPEPAQTVAARTTRVKSILMGLVRTAVGGSGR